jgi:hypothetical protein
MVEINATTGPRVYDTVEEMLRNQVEDSHANKHRAMGVAVGAHCRAADDFSGYLSYGENYTRLAGPQNLLRHLFLGR